MPRHHFKRRLHDGREVDVGWNHGVRKICRCGRPRWWKCHHPPHFNFFHGGVHHRISLDQYAGRHIDSRAEAEALADEIRSAIRAGTFGKAPSVTEPPATVEAGKLILTLTQLAAQWTRHHGHNLASAKLDAYRLKTIHSFVQPATEPAIKLGDKAAEAVTLLDIETFRDYRKEKGLSAVAVNHDLRLLRKIFNWGIRKGLITRTPFKIGTEPAIRLEREIPRNKRLSAEEEERLLAVADPLLLAIIVAILETACRPGEILNLQWQDVSLERREFIVRAEKAKTRTERLIPVSSRLLAVLKMRQQDPAGEDLPPTAYVFGDALGGKVKSVRPLWDRARVAGKITDLHLADLRHEAASRFDEAGVPINFVSKILGHTNLTTTSRYLNIHRRGLHLAMEKFEEHRRLASGLQETEPATNEPAEEITPASDDNPLVLQ